MANTTAETTGIETQVAFGHTEHGTPQLRVVVRFTSDMPYRHCRAALLTLAAAIERLSLRENWVVIIGDVNHAGRSRKQARIDLELAVGSARETEAGLDVLHRAVHEVR